MDRRCFLGTVETLPLALRPQEGPPVSDPVEAMTAPATPTIALNHLGFRPRVGEKRLVVRVTGPALAYRQLEWIMGANPFAACMMTGEGIRHPYPHSRFVGLIPGGIMNGIAGNDRDEPVLDMAHGLNWRTSEYWSPHVAYYIWAHSVLETIS